MTNFFFFFLSMSSMHSEGIYISKCVQVCHSPADMDLIRSVDWNVMKGSWLRCVAPNSPVESVPSWP
jgi:hypothetical protein